MKTSALVALSYLLALTACGGGGDSGAPAPTAAPTVAACPAGLTAKVVRIQFFGDSTSIGYDGATGVFTHDPALYLQQSMDERFGAGAVVVEMRGVSGSSSLSLILGADGLNAPWPAPVAADIVMVNHGINDAQQPTGIERYRANLRAFASGPWVTLFETPNPNWNRPILDDDYAQAMRDEAKALGVPVADTAAYMTAMPGWQQLVPDGIHPTADGYWRINRDVVAPAIAPLVAKARCV